MISSVLIRQDLKKAIVSWTVTVPSLIKQVASVFKEEANVKRLRYLLAKRISYWKHIPELQFIQQGTSHGEFEEANLENSMKAIDIQLEEINKRRKQAQLQQPNLPSEAQAKPQQPKLSNETQSKLQPSKPSSEKPTKKDVDVDDSFYQDEEAMEDFLEDVNYEDAEEFQDYEDFEDFEDFEEEEEEKPEPPPKKKSPRKNK